MEMASSATAIPRTEQGLQALTLRACRRVRMSILVDRNIDEDGDEMRYMKVLEANGDETEIDRYRLWT